ncbi:hypothetical protein [Glacieibacterium frigidum]|uniref:DUF4329 domain-containing protein n=1 Tax=Glacieibacterium frigidum TaxID=2593303 RepID=A0A552U7S8_9SPHN|nr:hypothetical protein [Glacieibacterium frigidum]TRW14273.1 hypothetical protein FMM06_11185 [Glacieibacterium frigidum]
MQVQGDIGIRSATTSQPTTRSPAEAVIDQATTAFGTIDTRMLAQAVLGPMLAGGPANASLLRDIGSQLSPVQQGNLQRDITDTVEKLVESIMKFFNGLFGSAATTPTAPPAATLPPAASDSAQVPGLESIARDPVVASAIEASWNASNPNTPGAKVETGFWVVRDNATGALSVVQFPSNGTNDSLTPGAPPAIDGKTTVAFFHTHPNTSAEGYTSGPSSADQRFADATGIPGIIRSHDGMYYFNNR